MLRNHSIAFCMLKRDGFKQRKNFVCENAGQIVTTYEAVCISTLLKNLTKTYKPCDEATL